MRSPSGSVATTVLPSSEKVTSSVAPVDGGVTGFRTRGHRDQGGRRDLESLAYADAVGIAEVVGLSENAPLARRSEVLLGDRGEGVAGLNDVFLHGGLTSCPPVETRGGIEGTVKVRQLTTSRIEPSMGNGGWPDGF